MDSKEWTNVIIVMVIIAVAVSFVSSSFTGNTINVPASTSLQTVYTKAEIDDQLKGIYLGGDAYSLVAGGVSGAYGFNTVWVNNTKVVLQNVGEGGTVLVSINNVITTIGLGETKNINGLSIKNIATKYNLEVTKRAAILNIMNYINNSGGGNSTNYCGPTCPIGMCDYTTGICRV